MNNPLQTPGPGRKLNALVVDDDAFMLEYIADLLRGLGATSVATAQTGTQACAAYDRQATKPDVVICDLAMPGSDGFQFMQMLAERQFKGGVIVVSGADARTLHSASLMGRFHRLGILGCLAKPIDATALSRALAGAS